MDEAGIPMIQTTVGSSYRDYSRLAVDEAEQIWGQKRAFAADTQFPMKSYDMLVQAEPDMDHIVSWQPHGRSFLIHNKDRFVEQILPAFVRQSKYASFQRQLNLYGFQRITHGPDGGSYYHEQFLRGKRFLARFIERHRIKGTGRRQRTHPETEPDFFRLPFLPGIKKSPDPGIAIHRPHPLSTLLPSVAGLELPLARPFTVSPVVHQRRFLAQPIQQLGLQPQQGAKPPYLPPPVRLFAHNVFYESQNAQLLSGLLLVQGAEDRQMKTEALLERMNHRPSDLRPPLFPDTQFMVPRTSCRSMDSLLVQMLRNSQVIRRPKADSVGW